MRKFKNKTEAKKTLKEKSDNELTEFYALAKKENLSVEVLDLIAEVRSEIG